MSIEEMVERLRRIPDKVRTYDCDARYAQLHLGLNAEHMQQIVGAGVPSVDVNGEAHFEYGDLYYIAMRLGVATTFLWAARQWARSLEIFAGRNETRVSIQYVTELAPPVGEIDGVVYLPDGKQLAMKLVNGRAATEVDVVMRGPWPDPAPEANVVLEGLDRQLTFYELPRKWQGDTALARQTGFSDCVTSAHVIVEDCRAIGVEARVNAGFFVSHPVSVTHGWAEVRTEGEWVPVDPLMLAVMRDFGGLDAAQWPPQRSIGPMVSPVAAMPEKVMSADGAAVDATLLTTIEEDSSGVVSEASRSSGRPSLQR